MQIVVWKSPKFLGALLRGWFKIKKSVLDE